MTLLSAALLLFLVMDPVGNVPFFVSALSTVPPERQRRVVARELAIALGVLVVFLFTGRWLLTLLHISEPALGVAGGIILFLIAVHMIFPSPHRSLYESVRGEPFIVPLAIPYVAGPSAMATLILITSREPGRWPEWLLALLLAWGGTSVVLYFGSSMRRFLSERGLIAMERLMGMLLITVAIQMLMDGVDAFIGR